MGFKKSTSLIISLTIIFVCTYWAYIGFYNTPWQDFLVLWVFVLSLAPQVQQIVSTARLQILEMDTNEVWGKGLCLLPSFPVFGLLRVGFPFSLHHEKEYFDQTNVPEKVIPRYNNQRDDMIGMKSFNIATDSNTKVVALNTVNRIGNNLAIDPNEVRTKFFKLYYWIFIPFIAVAIPSKILANNFERFSSYTFIEPKIGQCVTLPTGEKIELSMPIYPTSWKISNDTKIFSINEDKFWMLKPTWKQVMEIIPKTKNGYQYVHPIKIVFPDGENQEVCF